MVAVLMSIWLARAAQDVLDGAGLIHTKAPPCHPQISSYGLDAGLPETDWWKQTAQLASAARTGGFKDAMRILFKKPHPSS